MHIVIININRMVDYKGGMSKSFSDLANLFVAVGYKVTAICFDKNQGNPGFPISSEVRFLNAYSKIPLLNQSLCKAIRSFSLDRKRRRAKRDLIDLDWMRNCFKLCLENISGIDLIISFQPESTYFLEKIMEETSQHIPVITMVHSTPEEVFGKEVFPYLYDYVAKSQAVQVLRPEFVEPVKSLFPGMKIEVIPNFINDGYKQSKHLSKKIICVSRVVPGKRIDLLVESFAVLQDKYPGWVVEIYGELERDKKYVQKIKNLISSRGMTDRCFLMGTTDDIYGALESASIFAFPSQFEGFGIAMVEAMACGLPILACSDCASVNTINENGKTGYLTDPEVSAYASAMDTMMGSSEIRKKLGERASIKARNFSKEKIAVKWNQLIEAVSEHE